MNEKSLRLLEFHKIINMLAEFAVSSMAKEEILNIRPKTEFDRIAVDLQEAEEAKTFIQRRGYPAIEGIFDITNSLKRAALGGILNPAELIKICDTLKVTKRLKDHVARDAIDMGVNIMETLIHALYLNKNLLERINAAILSEDEISDHASPSLYAVRRQILALKEGVKEKLNELIRSSKYQKAIQDNLVTMRGERYVIPVKQEHRGEFPGLIHDASASGATLFIEPMAVVELNNSIKQAKIKEAEEVEKVLKELTEAVVAILDELKSNMSLLTRVDVLFAKGRFAITHRCNKPSLNQEQHLRILQGRHPLLDPEKVVPVDFWMGKEFRTLVITGPNTGGKTVSLKTVGLFVLMTQAGLLIPANEGSTLCIFDNVHCDIGDEQSIEQSLSTFSSHMKNIVCILKEVSHNDFVLFDELGAGTDPQEGAALAIAILEHLFQKKILTVATTHYSELKGFALSHEGIENASCEFNIQTLMPTYKLLIGVPGKSNAFSISQKLGLSEAILQRARSFITHEGLQFEDVLSNLEKHLIAAKKEQEAAQTKSVEAQKLKEETQIAWEKMQEKREKMIQKAHEDAQKILSEAILNVDELIQEIKENRRQETAEHRLNAAREMRQTLVKKIKQVRGSFIEANHIDSESEIKNLRVGEQVFIKSLNQEATVLAPPDKNGDVRVMAGIMKMHISVNLLKRISTAVEQASTPKKSIKRLENMKAQNIKTEIHLRGMTIDEALAELDKYLDDATMANLSGVRVVHGKGTGALRQAVHKFLKNHAHVADFRLGLYGEGENGVTIVQLK